MSKDNTPLDPFSVALADHISGQDPELEDAVEGELDGLLSDDDEEFTKALEETHREYFGPRPDNTVVGPETGLDPFADPLKD